MCAFFYCAPESERKPLSTLISQVFVHRFELSVSCVNRFVTSIQVRTCPAGSSRYDSFAAAAAAVVFNIFYKVDFCCCLQSFFCDLRVDGRQREQYSQSPTYSQTAQQKTETGTKKIKERGSAPLSSPPFRLLHCSMCMISRGLRSSYGPTTTATSCTT